jgi:hypothetical protein
MITDVTALAEIRKSWEGVEQMRAKLQRSAFATAAFGIGGVFPHVLADAAHNLPFMHAHAVLNDTLQQFAAEGIINCKSRYLGPLMAAAIPVLSWQDLSVIQIGIDHRNDVAHRAKLLPRGECWKHIDAIGRELKAWGIII